MLLYRGSLTLLCRGSPTLLHRGCLTLLRCGGLTLEDSKSCIWNQAFGIEHLQEREWTMEKPEKENQRMMTEEGIHTREIHVYRGALAFSWKSKHDSLNDRRVRGDFEYIVLPIFELDSYLPLLDWDGRTYD